MSVGVNPRQLQTITHKNNARDAARRVAIAAESTVSATIVVGLPVDRQGREGLQARSTRRFLEQLKTEAPWAHIVTLNEQLTTVEARERLNAASVSKEHHSCLVDGIAASILLERFFSDADEDKPQTIQLGTGSLERQVQRVENRQSFAEWKRHAMEKAQQMQLELRSMR